MENDHRTNFQAANREASVILFRRSNRFKLIEGLLFCITAVLFAFLLREACLQTATVLAKTNGGKILLVLTGGLLFWGFLIFVVAPLFLGLLQMAARMANDEEVFLPDLFLPLSNGKRYLRALAVLLPFLWKIAAFFWLPGFLFDVLEAIFGEMLLFTVLDVVVSALLAAAWCLLALRGFVRLSFLLQWRMPLRASRRANRQIAGKSFSGGGFWWICYLPRILLGFLTVGILLVADVIPRMMISYFRYAGRMTDYAFSSEEPNYE